MFKKPQRKKIRQKKHQRVRNKIFGTAERPRLSVYRSLKHMYAQLINDEEGITVATASTLEAGFGDSVDSTGNIDAAKKVGEQLGKKALEKGIKQVVFDRGGNIYHGRIAAVAEGAREAGLEF